MDLLRFLGRRLLDGLPGGRDRHLPRRRALRRCTRCRSSWVTSLARPGSGAQPTVAPLGGAGRCPAAGPDRVIRPVDGMKMLDRLTGGNPFFISEIRGRGERRTSRRRSATRCWPGPRACHPPGPWGHVGRGGRARAPQADVAPADLGRGRRALVQAVDRVRRRRHARRGRGPAWSFRHELARLAIEQALGTSGRAALPCMRAPPRRIARPPRIRRPPAATRPPPRPTPGWWRTPSGPPAAARLGAHREAAAQYRLALR